MESLERPWTTAQVRVVVAADALAAIVVVVAAMAAQDERSLQDQVTWINVGVLGLLMSVLAHGTLLLVARRAIGLRRLQVLPDAAVAAGVPPVVSDGRWWWLPGTTRAHTAGCQMIAGKPAQEISPTQIRRRRLTRCELCG